MNAPTPATSRAPAEDAAADDLTDQHLRLAFRQMRRPAGWPPSFDAVMEDPARAACLRGYARSVARTLGRPPFQPPRARPAHSLPTGPVPATPVAAHTKAQATPARRTAFDARKAAANDFDD